MFIISSIKKFLLNFKLSNLIGKLMDIKLGTTRIGEIFQGKEPVNDVFYDNNTQWSPSGSNIYNWVSTNSEGYEILDAYKGPYDNTVQVPTLSGTTKVNCYSTTPSTPFYNNPSVISVDLQHVPYVNNDMTNAFYNCQNLTGVFNINNSTIVLDNAFKDCKNLTHSNTVFLYSPNIISVNGMFNNTSKAKRVYIYDSYCNGTYTNTYESFKRAGYIKYDSILDRDIETGLDGVSLGYYVDYFNSRWDYEITGKNITLLNYKKTLDGTKENSSVNVRNPLPYPDANIQYIKRECFRNVNAYSIDLDNATFKNRNATYAFSNCRYLRYINNLNLQDLRIMWDTFRDCYNFNQNLTLPRTLEGMKGTFMDCKSFNQNITIPSSVRNMQQTFQGCTNFNSRIRIPEYVQSAAGTFEECSNLDKDIIIGNSVSDLAYTFHNCLSFNRPVSIPGSVINMSGTFRNCKNLSQKIQIPSSVTNISSAFYGCINMSEVEVEGADITNAKNLFTGTTKEKNVYIPFTYVDGTITNTFNAFKTANYIKSDNTTNHQHGVTIIDISRTNSDPLFLDWQALQVRDNKITLTQYKGSGTNVKVPAGKKYTLEASVFKNTQVTKVDLSGTSWVGNSMSSSFDNCKNLVFVSNINPNVTNMHKTFNGCTDFNQNIQIPSSVASLTSTFSGCTSFNQNVQIPGLVTSMDSTFNGCSSFNQDIKLPNYIMYLNGTFYECNTLNQPIQIPNSVIDVSYTFGYCTNLNQNIQIPSSVTSMDSTFVGCTNFNYNIQIPSSVASLSYTFSGCSNFNQNVQIPGSVISMQNTFKDCTSFNQNIQIPDSVTSMMGTFYGCTKFNQNVRISNSALDISEIFDGCTNFNQNIQIPNSVYTIRSAFFDCPNFNQNIQIPDSVIDMSSTFFNCYNFNQNIQIPNSVTSLEATFANCTSLNQDIQIPSSVTSMSWSFQGCTNLASNISIRSENVEGASFCFDSTTLSKNVYIPFKYMNNTNTKTFNSFVTAGYLTSEGVSTGQNGVNLLEDISIYNLTDWQYISELGRIYLKKYTGSDTANIVVPSNYNLPKLYIEVGSFYNNSVIKKVDLNNIPFSVSIDYNNTTNMYSAFYNCRNLEEVSNINTSTTNLEWTFGDCRNLNCTMIIPSNVVAMANTFYECTKLQANIKIQSENVTRANDCFVHTSLPKNVYIPYNYTNGERTKTFNSFVTAGYLASDGTSTGQHGVQIYDLNAQ